MRISGYNRETSWDTTQEPFTQDHGYVQNNEVYGKHSDNPWQPVQVATLPGHELVYNKEISVNN